MACQSPPRRHRAMLCSAVLLAFGATSAQAADQFRQAADGSSIECAVSARELTRFALIDDQFASVSKISSGTPYNDFAVTNEPLRGDVRGGRQAQRAREPRRQRRRVDFQERAVERAHRVIVPTTAVAEDAVDGDRAAGGGQLPGEQPGVEVAVGAHQPLVRGRGEVEQALELGADLGDDGLDGAVPRAMGAVPYRLSMYSITSRQAESAMPASVPSSSSPGSPK